MSLYINRCYVKFVGNTLGKRCQALNHDLLLYCCVPLCVWSCIEHPTPPHPPPHPVFTAIQQLALRPTGNADGLAFKYPILYAVFVHSLDSQTEVLSQQKGW